MAAFSKLSSLMLVDLPSYQNRRPRPPNRPPIHKTSVKRLRQSQTKDQGQLRRGSPGQIALRLGAVPEGIATTESNHL